MNKATSVVAEVGDKTFRFETGLLAQQAAGSVTVQLGETVVFSAVTVSPKAREGIDYFPLQVEYREKFYAAGRMPGGYFKREARPSEKEILTARVTDRPLRPLFPETFRRDVQINNMMLCTDTENEADILSINAASSALMLTDIPFHGPIAAVRVGRVNGRFILNPLHSELRDSDLDLIYVGTRDLPMMIEGSAKEIGESDMLEAMRIAHEGILPLIDAQYALRREAGLPERATPETPPTPEWDERLRALIGDRLSDALVIGDKLERQSAVSALKDEAKAALLEKHPDMTDEDFAQAYDRLEIRTVRDNILQRKRRAGDRGFDELRPLASQVAVLPRTHGSALFNRGETQALSVVTLGTTGDAQEMDGLSGGPDEKRFMLHYNFPPYSVGEVGRLGSTGRREIGHGALAERSLKPVIPDDYPYTVRVVSEVMGSNGSSSMGTVCAGCLSLMDAGIPITKPVAGISIGLVTGGDEAILLTDIIGSEDHCGDMDFKVAGTRDGITGFQVDLKLHGLRWDLVEGAFKAAREARLKILDHMAATLEAPRPDLSPYAPRITVVQINPEKIGALIGPGGKNIRRITDTTGAKIDIDDDGTVHIFSNDKTAMDAAVAEVNLIAAEAEVGKIYRGTVTGIKDFGAFVEILPGKEGLVHISELANFRVKQVTDVVKMGEQIWVKCINVDESGKVRLSRKAALEDKDLETEEG